MSGDETWATPAEQSGWRLDKAVAARPSVRARRRARDVVESGKVSVDGRPCSNPGQSLEEGHVVTIAWNQPGTGRAHRLARVAVASAGVAVLHEDAWLLVVDKPPGLLTDAATRKQERERDTVTARLRKYLRPQGKTPFPAHRIDRDTSGAVLFAKDRVTFDALRAQFHARTPERVYLAAVEGRPTPSEGTWSDWMAWDKERLLQVSAAPDTPGAVLAQAHYRVVAERKRGRAVVRVQLVTGRRNQIRVHAMLRGHPLVGERQYLPPGRETRRPGLARHALHAHRLAFDHPRTGERLEVESPVPPDLRRVM